VSVTVSITNVVCRQSVECISTMSGYVLGWHWE